MDEHGDAAGFGDLHGGERLGVAAGDLHPVGAHRRQHGGPDQGELCHPGFIAASTDPVATDAVGLAHLRLVGTNDVIGKGSIWRIPMMRCAAEIGVGVGTTDGIKLVGIAPEAAARLRVEMS